MADFNRNMGFAQYGRRMTGAEAAIIDEGLRAYMLRIYNFMVLGLAITGFAALGAYMLSVTDTPSHAAYILRAGQLVPVEPGVTVQPHDVLLTNFGYAVFIGPLKWVIALAPIGLVFLLGYRVERMSAAATQVTFWVFAGVMGLSLGVIFLVFTHTSVVQVFFITAASFGALSLWGYSTQRDLTGMGSFLIMGLLGIIIAGLVNIFIGSTMLQWLISVVGVLVFAGLTAWDTQRLKDEYVASAMTGELAEKSAILGALSLYLNFINLFMLLLQLFGNREE